MLGMKESAFSFGPSYNTLLAMSLPPGQSYLSDIGAERDLTTVQTNQTQSETALQEDSATGLPNWPPEVLRNIARYLDYQTLYSFCCSSEEVHAQGRLSLITQPVIHPDRRCSDLLESLFPKPKEVGSDDEVEALIAPRTVKILDFVASPWTLFGAGSCCGENNSQYSLDSLETITCYPDPARKEEEDKDCLSWKDVAESVYTLAKVITIARSLTNISSARYLTMGRNKSQMLLFQRQIQIVFSNSAIEANLTQRYQLEGCIMQQTELDTVMLPPQSDDSVSIDVDINISQWWKAAQKIMPDGLPKTMQWEVFSDEVREHLATIPDVVESLHGKQLADQITFWLQGEDVEDVVSLGDQDRRIFVCD